VTAPLLGRPEAAMLLAVEGANGGELSGLEQVLVAFETLFDRQMEPEAYAQSCALLCEAGLVEFVEGCLGLTPAGRKLLRRTGVPGNPGRPHNVAEQLAPLEELDLAGEGSVPSPTVAAFEAAGAALKSDGAAGDAPLLGSELAPRPRGILSGYGGINQGSTRRSPLFHEHDAPVRDAPRVRPDDWDEPEPGPGPGPDG